MTTDKIHIADLFTSNQVFGKVSSSPTLISGQSALVVSNGGIPGTSDGSLYFIPFGGGPIELGGGGGGVVYEDFATSGATNPDPDLAVTDMNLDTGGNVSLTLTDPSTPLLGVSSKTIIVSRFTSGSSLTLNINTFVGGSGINYTTIGQSTTFLWTAGGWAITGGAGGSVF